MSRGNEKRCEGGVRGAWGGRDRCPHKGAGTHKGKRYCKKHHPLIVAARDALRDPKYRAKYATRGWNRLRANTNHFAEIGAMVVELVDGDDTSRGWDELADGALAIVMKRDAELADAFEAKVAADAVLAEAEAELARLRKAWPNLEAR